MDSLAKKYNRREIRKDFGQFAKGTGRYLLWSHAENRSQDEEDVKLAKQVLSWISFAFRPLTIIGVQHALALELGDRDFDEDARPDRHVLVSVCAGLVTIDQKSKVTRLVHYTTQEYFERICMAKFPDGQANISMTCLTYISFDVFAEGSRVD